MSAETGAFVVGIVVLILVVLLLIGFDHIEKGD